MVLTFFLLCVEVEEVASEAVDGERSDWEEGEGRIVLEEGMDESGMCT